MTTQNSIMLVASTKQWKILLGGMVLGTLASAFLATTATKLGWWMAGFFILMMPLFVAQLHPVANHVLLTHEGFHLRVFFRTHKYCWDDIQSVFIAPLAGDRVLAFDFKESYPNLRKTRAMTKRLSGFEGSFPVIASHTPEEVLNLVLKFKDGGTMPNQSLHSDGAASGTAGELQR